MSLEHYTISYTLPEPYIELFDLAQKNFPLPNLWQIQFAQVDNGTTDICAEVKDLAEPILEYDVRRITNRTKQSLTRMLKLPPDSSNRPTKWYRPLAFAHSLGHLIQTDPAVGELFGMINPQRIPLIPKRLKEFDESQRELHANFVTATLLGQASIADCFGLRPHRYRPIEWRQWAKFRIA